MAGSIPSLLTCRGVIEGSGAFLDGIDSFLIDAGLIVSRGRRQDLLDRHPAARILDYSGAFALPGLINAHDHVLFRRSRLPLADHFRLPAGAQALFGATSAIRSLAEGVTSVRDMGAPGALSERLAQAVVDSTIPGPDIVPCVKAITVPGGPGLALSVPVSSDSEARDAVLRIADLGAGFIKVFASTDGSSAQQPLLTESMLQAVCRAADEVDLIVAAHATTRESVVACIRAGVRCIEHGVEIDAAIAREMVSSGVWFAPTLSGFHIIGAEGHRWGRAPHVVDYFSSVLTDHQRAFEHALEAGVRFAAGTDSLGTMAMEMTMMAECGASIGQVIRAATVDGAELLGLDRGVGRLMPGSPADILLLPSNPLCDAHALTEPVAVIKGGVVYRVAELTALFASQ